MMDLRKEVEKLVTDWYDNSDEDTIIMNKDYAPLTGVIESFARKVRNEALDEAANKVCGMDHCDLNGHGCTTEIRDAIRALKDGDK